MTKATSASSASPNSDGGAAVPSGDALLVTTNAEGSDGTAESDGGSGETLRAVHAAFMLFAFVIIFPLGAVLLRYLSSGVKVHGTLQTIGVVFTVVGGGLGIALSKMDNDVSNNLLITQLFRSRVNGSERFFLALAPDHRSCPLRYRLRSMDSRLVAPPSLSRAFSPDCIRQDASGPWASDLDLGSCEWIPRLRS